MSLISSPNGAKLGPKVTKLIGVDGSKVTKNPPPRPNILKGWSIVVTNDVPTGV
jgi:hypothetical protein